MKRIVQISLCLALIAAIFKVQDVHSATISLIFAAFIMNSLITNKETIN